jgi:hypothetical protein
VNRVAIILRFSIAKVMSILVPHAARARPWDSVHFLSVNSHTIGARLGVSAVQVTIQCEIAAELRLHDTDLHHINPIGEDRSTIP